MKELTFNDSVLDIVNKMKSTTPEAFKGATGGTTHYDEATRECSFTWNGPNGPTRIELDFNYVLENLELLRRISVD